MRFLVLSGFPEAIAPFSCYSMTYRFHTLACAVLVCVSSLWISLSPTLVRAAEHAPSRTDDDPRFSLAELSPAFVGDSDAVVRLDERTLEIHDEDDATYRVRRAITVYSKKGRDFGEIRLRYGRFTDVDHLYGWVRNERGEIIRELSDQDVKDYAGSGGGTIYTDDRFKVATLTHSNYPYTVEFEYEIDFDGYIGLPTWYPQPSADLPVERAYFTLIADVEDDVRHTVRNGPLDVESRTEDGTTRTKWSILLKQAQDLPDYGPDWGTMAPALHLAPSYFEVSKVDGQLQSWSDFGAWMNKLMDGRQALPADLRRTVDAIANEATSERDLVKRLFEFMQGRTRYIGVQLGIGGWQPFSTEYVHERGYGDCKALTNYVYAMLKHVGIEAYPALINMDVSPPPLLTDFPSNQFNHMILAVPVEQDTLWLEATSQTIPFAHVHSGIQDRPALLVKPAGGELVRTPASRASDNRQVRTADVTVDASGDARVQLRTLQTGKQTDRQRSRLANPTPEEVDEWAQTTIAAPSVRVTDTNISEVGTRKRTVETTVAADLPRFASAAGARLFVPLNISPFSPAIPSPSSGDRATPVHISPYPWADVDSTTFTLPKGYAVEALPSGVSIETEAGAFRTMLTQRDDGTVTYIRRITYASPVLPASAYESFRDLTRAISRSDRQQMVLVKQ
jgi:hypothetical protein